MTTALVTGATAGIGNAFAHALAAQGHDLVLVARDGARLEQVAAEIRATSRVRVDLLPADLSNPKHLERVAERLRDGTRPVDVLVNNAGFAVGHRFVGGDLAQEERMLDVLVRAVLVLTHAALPGMVGRGSGRVVNVSSVAGFLPAGSYAAAKAWVTVFTLSLTSELAGTGVTAMVLCPGYVRTEFHQRMGVTRRGPTWAWLDADRLVRDALADLHRGRTLSVPSRRYAVAAAALRHLPLRLSGLVAKQAAARRSRS